MESHETPAPACSLGATEGMTRRERWLALGEAALLSKVATPTGVRLWYRAGGDVERELRALVELERECCSFATWSLASEGPGLLLDVSAEGNGVGSVRAMFDEADPLRAS